MVHLISFLPELLLKQYKHPPICKNPSQIFFEGSYGNNQTKYLSNFVFSSILQGSIKLIRIHATSLFF